MEILSPVPEMRAVAGQKLAHLDTIQGKVVGLLENGWRSGGIIVDRFDELLHSQNIETCRWKTETTGPDEKVVYDEIAQHSDAVIVAIAN